MFRWLVALKAIEGFREWVDGLDAGSGRDAPMSVNQNGDKKVTKTFRDCTGAPMSVNQNTDDEVTNAFRERAEDSGAGSGTDAPISTKQNRVNKVTDTFRE